MQKVTDFLEQHVQWIAIGLGALFCLYMTYSYVIKPPAVAEINGAAYGPSEIDPYTAETVVAKLQSAMTNSAKIKMEVPQYVQAFQSKMTWQDAEPIQLAGLVDPALTLDVPLPPPPQGTNGDTGFVMGNPLNPNQQVATAQKVTRLPVPPTPRQPDPVTAVKYGRSVVVPPPAPGQAPEAPQPGVVPQGAVDLDWVTQMWTVSMNDIETAFRNAGMHNLPPELRKTMFLHVEMVREEQVDGKWQNAMVIPHRGPTRNNQPMLPYPGDGPDPKLRQAQFQYAAWASTSTPDIIQPLFHVTVPDQGDQWTKPGAQLMAAQMFNPATHVGGRGNLTEEQWQAVLQYRRAQYKLQMEQKRNATPRGPRTPAGGGRDFPPDMGAEEGMYAPRQRNYAPARGLPHYAPARGLPHYASARGLPHYAPARGLPHYAPAPMRPPPYPVRGGYGNYPPDMGMEEMEMEGYGGAYGGPQVQNMPQPGTDYPAGEFDPTDSTQPMPWRGKDVEIWAHDDQVVSGKTYRYKMRYRLKNPIFGTNAGEPPELAEKFALVSEFSDWTTPVTVPSLVNFFVAGGFVPGRGTVNFEVFRWEQGQQKAETFSVGPGDAVGGERNGIDFTTDWTVVDFRDDPRAGGDAQILLVNNEDGSVIARSFNTDRNDRLYQALKKQVEEARAAERAAAAANGGVAPTGYGTAAAR